MRSASKRFKFMLCAVFALAAIAAIDVAPAAAEEVPVKSTPSVVKLTTTGVTVKKNGADPRTCTPFGGSISGTVNSEGSFALSNANFGQTLFLCSGSSQLEFSMWLLAHYETTTGVYSLRFSPSGGTVGRSPWGGMLRAGATFPGIWSNGAGETPSTVTYSEALVGYQSSTGEPITLSGTFTVTGSGGLVILSH